MYSGNHSSVVSLTTGQQLLPKASSPRGLSNASSFDSQYPLVSVTSASSCLRLLLSLLVTSIHPFIFRSITCFRRQHVNNPEETKTMAQLGEESLIRPSKYVLPFYIS